jgi:hypothetical protein
VAQILQKFGQHKIHNFGFLINEAKEQNVKSIVQSN